MGARPKGPGQKKKNPSATIGGSSSSTGRQNQGGLSSQSGLNAAGSGSFSSHLAGSRENINSTSNNNASPASSAATSEQLQQQHNRQRQPSMPSNEGKPSSATKNARILDHQQQSTQQVGLSMQTRRENIFASLVVSGQKRSETPLFFAFPTPGSSNQCEVT